MNEVFLDKLENRENHECENKNADKIISPTLALREKKNKCALRNRCKLN